MIAAIKSLKKLLIDQFDDYEYSEHIMDNLANAKITGFDGPTDDLVNGGFAWLLRIDIGNLVIITNHSQYNDGGGWCCQLESFQVTFEQEVVFDNLNYEPEGYLGEVLRTIIFNLSDCVETQVHNNTNAHDPFVLADTVPFGITDNELKAAEKVLDTLTSL